MERRPVKLGKVAVDLEPRPDGTLLIHPVGQLGPYPRKLTERLDHWAVTAPDRVFIAERDKSGGWRTVSYRDAHRRAREIGAALVRRDLSAERPIVILSGNSVDHALLALGALYAGIAYAPVSPSYASASADFGKLHHIMTLLTPGLVFAENGARFAEAIAATVPHDTELVVSHAPPPGRTATLLADLSAEPGAAIDAAHAAIGPDTVAKFLFTSGSTGLPKAVINTQRMLCSNQAMLLENLAFMKDEPPVMVDWLPWNHTFGGNHNVGIALYNGGSLYIDDGQPTPKGIERTVRNLKEIAPTLYFNVPKGFEALIPHFRNDAELSRLFFSRMNITFYAGAGLSQQVSDDLDAIAIESCGERIAMMCGLGATETAPFALVTAPGLSQSGNVGLPVPGVEVKLAPVDGKMEVRVKGPNITPGYWREPALTAKAYDEEGYYRMGDALAFIDPAKPELGLKFDGRIAEDFKLATGTWVSVGPLRAKLLSFFAPYVTDAVFAGLNEDDLTALFFVNETALRPLVPATTRSLPELVSAPQVRALFGKLLLDYSLISTGSSTRIARAILLDAPPSADAGEITDKGSINQRAVLAHRSALAAELYRRPWSPRVITAE